MALKKEIRTVYGEQREGYLRVENIRGDKDWIYFDLVGYLSREAAQSGAQSVWNCDYGFTPGGEGRWDKQAYEFLKTLPEYADAVDVLENEPEA